MNGGDISKARISDCDSEDTVSRSVRRPNLKEMIMNKLYMEDVSSISLKAIDLIQAELKNFDIELNDEQDDEIFDNVGFDM